MGHARRSVCGILFALGALGVVACDDAQPTAETPDIGEVTPLSEVQPNGCGGVTPLASPTGEAVRPGEPCGECDGVYVCAGADAIRCAGARPANACGGCGALAAAPGAACGHCGGVWECADGEFRCSDPRATNACGGCEDLGDAHPGVICDHGGGPGVARCAGLDEVRCVPLGANGCGGQAGLPATPGTYCGACRLGVWVCDGEDDLACWDPDKGLNGCGGCGALQGEPREPCGPCGGQWVCAGSGDAVTCESPPMNACGGCAELSGAPGTPCSGDDVWACVGSEAVACVPPGGNLCGGVTVLAQPPGAACGPCGDGHRICATLESTACVGASALNACGGCGFLPGAVGEACAPNGAWKCKGDKLECAFDANANPCGGAAELAQAPGMPCGTCDGGAWICNGFESVVCAGGRVEDYHAWPDADGDGFGDAAAEPVVQCELEAGFVRNGDDCDDGDDAIHPDALEVCDGLDNDCDGHVDPGWAIGATVFYRDRDGDGFGDDKSPKWACAQPPGYVPVGGDCDDHDPAFYPGAPGEACDDPNDYNCDGETLWVDEDGDGWPSCDGTIDCDDTNPDVHPGAAERCNGIDDNCDGLTDVGAVDALPFYRDLDGDGFGDPDHVVYACSAPPGYVDDDRDCDDTDPDVHPDAVEICDGLDNDCNGVTDTDTHVDLKTRWYRDADGDGFGAEHEVAFDCDRPPGFVARGGFDDHSTERFDCAPFDPSRHPNSPTAPPGTPIVVEVCDFVDNDCNGHTDMGPWLGVAWAPWPEGAAPPFAWRVDKDGDGYGDPTHTVLGCHPLVPGAAPVHPVFGFPYIPDEGEPDCNDLNPHIHPGAAEIPGDGVDQNCDGKELCFVDADGDGAVGDFSLTVEIDGLDCAPTADNPHIAAAGAPWDCDDTDPTVHPGAVEIWGDEKDSDCDGVEICYADLDGDGFRSADTSRFVLSATITCGDRHLGQAAASQAPLDCDDADPNASPAAVDPLHGDRDRDCDGAPGSAWRTVFVAPGGSLAPGCGAKGDPCGDVALAMDLAANCPAVVPSFIAWCQSGCYPTDAACHAACEARGAQGNPCDVRLAAGEYMVADTLIVPPGVSVRGAGAASTTLSAAAPVTTTLAVPDVSRSVWLVGLTLRGPHLGPMDTDLERAPDSVALDLGAVGGGRVTLLDVTVVGGRGADGVMLRPPTDGTCHCAPGAPGRYSTVWNPRGRANYDLLELPFAPARGEDGWHTGRGGGVGGGNSYGIHNRGAYLVLDQQVRVVLGQGGRGANGGVGICADGTTDCFAQALTSDHVGECCGRPSDTSWDSRYWAGGGGAGGSAVGLALDRGVSIPDAFRRSIFEIDVAAGGPAGAGGCHGGAFMLRDQCSAPGEPGLVFDVFRSTALARNHCGVQVGSAANLFHSTEFSTCSLAEGEVPYVPGGRRFVQARAHCQSVGANLGSTQWPDSPSFMRYGLAGATYQWTPYPDAGTSHGIGRFFIDFYRPPHGTPIGPAPDETLGAVFDFNWADLGVPNPEPSRGEDCVEIYSVPDDRRWNDFDCLAQRDFACERPLVRCSGTCAGSDTCIALPSGALAPAASCSGEDCGACVGTTPDPSGDARFGTYTRTGGAGVVVGVFSAGVPWDHARQACGDFGGHLLAARSETDWDALETLLANVDREFPGVWIGLNDRLTEGQWYWDGVGFAGDLDYGWSADNPNNVSFPVCGGMLHPPTESQPGLGQSVASRAICDAGGKPVCREPFVSCPYPRRGYTCELCAEGFAMDASGTCRAVCGPGACAYGGCSDCHARGDCATNPEIVCQCPSGRVGDRCEACEAGFLDRERDGTCVPTCAGGWCGPVHGCDDAAWRVTCLDGCPEGTEDHGRTGVCVCEEGHAGPDCQGCAPGYAALPSGRCVIPPIDGLFGEWRLNALSGTVARETLGAMNGWLEGFHLTGYPDQAPGSGWTSDGVFGPGALSFDGIDDQAVLVLADPRSGGAAEVWFKTVEHKEGVILSSPAGTLRVTAGGHLVARIRNVDLDAGAVAPGTWHHAVMVDGGTEGGFHACVSRALYLNGHHTENPVFTWCYSEWTNVLRLGWSGEAGGAYFRGTVDQVRYWDRPLSAAEVEALHQAGRTALGL